MISITNHFVFTFNIKFQNKLAIQFPISSKREEAFKKLHDRVMKFRQIVAELEFFGEHP